MIKKSDLLNYSIDVIFAKNQEEVMALFAWNTPDFLICDIDLGPDSPDGFQIIRELRKSGYQQAICIHSNCGLTEYYEASLKVGAQANLPKPMTIGLLVEFLADSLPDRQYTPRLLKKDGQ